MNDNPGKKSAEAALSKQAVACAEMLARRVVEGAVLAEVLDHQSLWTEFRSLHKQFMRVWQELTSVVVAVDRDGKLAGWLVEKRKADSTRNVLTDGEVETRARGAANIRFDWKLTGVRRLQVDKVHSHAVATFIDPASKEAVEVYINHTSGELIGYLPVRTGPPLPLPTDNEQAREATELAWTRLRAELAVRVGADAANHAREVMKLTAESASADSSGRSYRVFRVWQYFSNSEVSIDERTSETVSWYMEALRDNATERRIDEAAAVQVARQEGKPGEGAQGPKVTFKREQDAERATVYWWHAEDGVNVEGDQVAVGINATTGRAFSLARKWRKIPRDLVREPKINAETAMQLAGQAIKREPTAPAGRIIGRCVIQTSSNPDEPGPVRELQVWRVGFSSARDIAFTDVSVDCQTGEIARVTGW